MVIEIMTGVGGFDAVILPRPAGADIGRRR
jgi:hypothetical protein